MRKIILALFALAVFSINAQELENDTIYCGNSQVILSLPSRSIKRVRIDRYEEGFYRDYPLIVSFKPSYLPYIILQYGALSEFVLPDPDSVIYECKLGNVANSICFTSDGKYFRRDKYPQDAISVFFIDVAEEDLELANYILDNLKIYQVPKQ